MIMALWEEVQDIAEQFSEMTEAEVEEDLQWHFKHIEPWHRERKMHNGNGWFADFAWSERCLAAGHEKDPQALDDDGAYHDHEDALYGDGTHCSGFDGDVLCTETKWGTCCTTCEGEDCEYGFGELKPSLWEMVSAK